MKLTHLPIDGAEALPLARGVQMPEGFSAAAAALSIRFETISFPSGLKIASRSHEALGEDTLVSFTLKPTPVEISYTLEAKADPTYDFDMGGRLETIKASENTAEKEAWLDAARDERTRLAQTPNGQKLLIEYGKHNEIFDEAFHNKPFLTIWRKEGITEAMSRDTYDAVKGNAIINDKTYKSQTDGTVTYNSHAFEEQTALALAILYLDPEFDPLDPGGSPQTKYTEAADAVVAFGDVVSSTGNTEEESRYVTPKEVYNHVNTYDANTVLKHHSRRDTFNEALRYYTTQQAGNDAAGEDKYGFGDMINAMLKQRAQDGRVKGQALVKGQCSGMLPEGTAAASILISREQGTICDITVKDVHLPDFDLELDSGKWDQAIKDKLENELTDMAFLQEYLHACVKRAIGKSLCEAVCEDENFHPF